ncbi:DUF1868 domain-containing protein [Stappia sp.]|uniref:DUF1868 domain-containing protein n=1 Tax=Stappia sp. TaxID=1870903 RepID=UPI0025DC588F|nr:DUF1868 domain-containing protein [Stappia sp.]
MSLSLPGPSMNDASPSPVSVSPELRPFSESLNPAPLRHLGRRHDAAGTFLPEPGNTVVCHLVEGSASHAAVLEARAALLDLPEARERLAATPASSLHMTLFQGIIEFRRDWPFWPKDIPADTPVETMTAHYLERLAGFTPGRAFAMRPKALTPNGLVLVPVDAASAISLSDWRDRLSEVFGYRHPDHDDYAFHVTFAYLRRRLSDEAIRAWDAAVPGILDKLARAAPVIELAPPAFCRFEDMKHFEELLVLDGREGERFA